LKVGVISAWVLSGWLITGYTLWPLWNSTMPYSRVMFVVVVGVDGGVLGPLSYIPFWIIQRMDVRAAVSTK